MRNKLLFFLFHLILLAACSESHRINKIPVYNPDKRDTINTSIFYFDKSMPMFSNTGKSINLSELEIIEVNKILFDCVNANYNSLTRKFDINKWYFIFKRQYIPYENKKGEKLIWVNCFCDTDNFKNWKTDLIKAYRVEDGGDCFINVTINLTTKQFSPLHRNGDG